MSTGNKSKNSSHDFSIRKGNSYLKKKYDKLKGELSRDQIIEFTESFNLFDKDGSGFIDVNELGLVSRLNIEFDCMHLCRIKI